MVQEASPQFRRRLITPPKIEIPVIACQSGEVPLVDRVNSLAVLKRLLPIDVNRRAVELRNHVSQANSIRLPVPSPLRQRAPVVHPGVLRD